MSELDDLTPQDDTADVVPAADAGSDESPLADGDEAALTNEFLTEDDLLA